MGRFRIIIIKFKIWYTSFLEQNTGLITCIYFFKISLLAIFWRKTWKFWYWEIVEVFKKRFTPFSTNFWWFFRKLFPLLKIKRNTNSYVKKLKFLNPKIPLFDISLKGTFFFFLLKKRYLEFFLYSLYSYEIKLKFLGKKQVFFFTFC